MRRRHVVSSTTNGLTSRDIAELNDSLSKLAGTHTSAPSVTRSAPASPTAEPSSGWTSNATSPFADSEFDSRPSSNTSWGSSSSSDGPELTFDPTAAKDIGHYFFRHPSLGVAHATLRRHAIHNTKKLLSVASKTALLAIGVASEDVEGVLSIAAQARTDMGLAIDAVVPEPCSPRSAFKKIPTSPGTSSGSSLPSSAPISSPSSRPSSPSSDIDAHGFDSDSDSSADTRKLRLRKRTIITSHTPSDASGGASSGEMFVLRKASPMEDQLFCDTAASASASASAAVASAGAGGGVGRTPAATMRPVAGSPVPSPASLPSASPSMSPTAKDIEDATVDFSCPVCLGLAVEPVTLLCGHSLCRRCCALSFELSNRCPCGCGRYLPPLLPEVNTVLRSRIQASFPNEYAERVEEVKQQALTRPVTYNTFFNNAISREPSSLPSLVWIYAFAAVAIAVMMLEAGINVTDWFYAKDQRHNLWMPVEPEYRVNAIAHWVAVYVIWGSAPANMLYESMNWTWALAEVFMPVTTLSFSLAWTFFARYPLLVLCCLTVSIAETCYFISCLKRMYRSRRLIGYTPRAAFSDCLTVGGVAVLCSNVIGALIAPFSVCVVMEPWATALGAPVGSPIGLSIVFFTLISPPFCAFLFRLAQPDA